jgi:hypothetical protein
MCILCIYQRAVYWPPFSKVKVLSMYKEANRKMDEHYDLSKPRPLIALRSRDIRSGFLLAFVRISLILRIGCLSNRRPSVQSRLPLASNIQKDGLNSVGACMPAFPKRINANASTGTEEPKDAHRHPASKEGFAEDVARSIHRHRPKN